MIRSCSHVCLLFVLFYGAQYYHLVVRSIEKIQRFIRKGKIVIDTLI